MNVGCQGLVIGWQAEVSATFVVGLTLVSAGWDYVISRNSFMVVICGTAEIAIVDLVENIRRWEDMLCV
jgi:hypothetical protein